MGIVSQIKSLLTGSAHLPVAADWEQLSADQLNAQHAAGRRILAARESLAAEGHSVIDLVLNGNPFEHWQMYPWQGGILDQRNHSQYFYHAHADYKGEHGHFHTFYYQQRKLVHLVAIGMDKKGRLNRLYTFNRWGPGDTYFPAARLKRFLPRFNIGPKNDLDRRLHAFVNDTLILFRPEIEVLCDERDATFQHYREQHGGASPYEDRELEITSDLAVDVDVQMERIAEALQRRGAWDERPADSEPVGPVAASEPPPATEPQILELQSLADRDQGHIQRSHTAGLKAMEILQKLKAKGTSLQQIVFNGKDFEDWEIYPWDGGVVDKKTRSQYFYHSHPQSPENGHFHVFYHHRNQLAHLVAISLDDQGQPMELFTVNRWVTGDFFLPAKKLKGFLTQFRITNNSFDRDLGDFIASMLVLYQHEIAALLEQRDQVFAEYRAAHQGRDPYEDRDLDVTSNLEIQVEHQLAALAAELKRREAT